MKKLILFAAIIIAVTSCTKVNITINASSNSTNQNLNNSTAGTSVNLKYPITNNAAYKL